MPIDVFDFHANLSNLVVEPQIRSRFRQVELGPVPPYHSHDLGGETFVVMAGQIEFTVAGESVVCQPGQAIYVPPRTTHAVRAVGDRPGVIYLSVSPHVEPTHTFYDAHGTALPPRYGVWREAGGGTLPDAPADVLLARYRDAAVRLAELATSNARAAGGRDEPDTLWSSLQPLLQHVETLERTWNAFSAAPRPPSAAPPDG
jgi:mannose-6-phosphate isomerase-like protein (cupin superfamily)